MAQNGTVWEWTEGKLLAAELLAEGRLTDTQIAAEAGTSRRTLARWKDAPEFQEKVREHAAALEAAILQRGIAMRANRVRALDDRWRRMQQVIEERGNDPSMRSVPGGKTGLLCHDIKVVGGGDSAERVDLYEVDTGLLKELREHEKQAAIELGQWDRDSEDAGDTAGPLTVVIQEIERRADTGSVPPADPVPGQ